MDILIHDALFAAAAMVYGLLAFFFWRACWGGEPTSGMPSATNPVRFASPRMLSVVFSWGPWVTAGGLVLHGVGLYGAMFDGWGMRFSFALALSLMFWLAALLYWIEGFRTRLDALQSLVLGLTAVASVLPLLFSEAHPLPLASRAGFRLHFASAMLAYSLFALAVLQAALQHVAERQLHRHRLSAGVSAMPPLLAMENMLFRMVTLGFGLLTVAVGSGVFFSEYVYGRPLRLDHKTIFAMASWGIFAALLLGRWRFGWRGRVAQRWLTAGFMALILAYVGSRFVLEVLLGR